MVYISSWQEYQAAAEELYTKQPTKTRYSVKWKASEGILVLKITDDTTCLKFKTHSSIILNRFEALNLSLMQKMQNWKPKPQAEAMEEDEVVASSPGGTTATQVANAGAAAANAGVKKKKGKKKK